MTLNKIKFLGALIVNGSVDELPDYEADLREQWIDNPRTVTQSVRYQFNVDLTNQGEYYVDIDIWMYSDEYDVVCSDIIIESVEFTFPEGNKILDIDQITSIEEDIKTYLLLC